MSTYDYVDLSWLSPKYNGEIISSYFIRFPWAGWLGLPPAWCGDPNSPLARSSTWHTFDLSWIKTRQSTMLFGRWHNSNLWNKQLSVSEKKKPGLDCIEAPSFQASCLFFKLRTMERNGWLCHLLLVWTIENKAKTAPWDADFPIFIFQCFALLKLF